MDTKIISIFCLCDDMLKAFAHRDNPQTQMTDTEVMTTALVAAIFFGGNYEKARSLLHDEGYISGMLSKSRFNRRLYRLEEMVQSLFDFLGEKWKAENPCSVYLLDSFPIPACDNYRIPRSIRYQGEVWRGYQVSKKRFFYGLKLHLMTTELGQPVEFFLTPSSTTDTSAYGWYAFDLPAGAWVTGDKAYTDYGIEDTLASCGIRMRTMRKANSKRPWPAWIVYLQATLRKMVETTGSLIVRLLPKSIHSVKPQGFELKVGLFALASSLNFLW